MDVLLIAGAINKTFYSKTVYQNNITNQQAMTISQIIGVIKGKHIGFNTIIILFEGVFEGLFKAKGQIKKALHNKVSEKLAHITKDGQIGTAPKRGRMSLFGRFKRDKQEAYDLFGDYLVISDEQRSILWRIGWLSSMGFGR